MAQCIVITGSTSGIGKELMNLYSQDENNLVFAGYRDSRKLDSAKRKNIINFYIDMTDRNSIIKAAEFIKSKTQQVNILINAAGSVVAGPIEKIDTGRLREQFDVNTFSHIEFTQRLSDILKNGRIVNISSMASFGNFPFISPYCASKRALDIFFNALTLENHSNFSIISIKLGVIATPIWEKSVKANLEYMKECPGYEKELNFIIKNALKNTHKGLNPQDTARKIYQISLLKKPKSSYLIGRDAKFAAFLSILPQDIINFVIKRGMEYRISKV